MLQSPGDSDVATTRRVTRPQNAQRHPGIDIGLDWEERKKEAEARAEEKAQSRAAAEARAAEREEQKH